MKSRRHTHATVTADPSERIVCRCLKVSEGQIQDAVAACELQTVRDLCEFTGAGDGCTACHAELRKYLQAHAKRAQNRVAVG